MKVLLAEDSRESRESLTRFLTRSGHEVTSCEDGLEAWRTLQKDPHSLVLTDIQMPRLSGQDLLARIKGDESLKNTEVVLFTGFGNIGSAVEAMQNGALDYLLKPINVEELTLLLERVESMMTLRTEHHQLREHFDEKVGEATRELESELATTREAIARLIGTQDIVVHSAAMQQLLRTAERLRAKPDLPVLIVGETGTGKELMARFVHYGDGTVTTPFVAINCAAINPNMFESELFGYEAGAFTGGNPKGQPGKLEAADGGSLFLDEISEMSPDLQAKLLRVIQEREYYRVGGVTRLKANVRIIAATNRELEDLIERSGFRRDLYYRLNVGLLKVPPLRERPDGIMAIAQRFVQDHLDEGRTRFTSFSDEAINKLVNYDWPGNVRELRNVIDRMVLLYDDEVVRPDHLEFDELTGPQSTLDKAGGELGPPLPSDQFDLDNHVLDIVEKALEQHEGNRSKTARYLGISRAALYTYLKHLEKR
ncbi:sigma-54 dependent transcriptional regulator [bacterium]|nr:sigma-54 dependent transcriptional regulator [bacterium]